ncbi:C-type lectin domain family 4 member K-like isoform X2 [Neocloeon triangulifer]|uniref:C-type lectin domain family 4 member K-like isoform X2 n=1 Tax=Neocloeon triangulifer TaxID=2078957 RepID=UPI00286F38DF|nr:C-type lectin domain family 4 member K-like isoform X2 [Neocloeon triangulifer]
MTKQMFPPLLVLILMLIVNSKCEQQIEQQVQFHDIDKDEKAPCKPSVSFEDFSSLEKTLCDKRVELAEEKLKSMTAQLNLQKMYWESHWKTVKESGELKLAKCEEQKKIFNRIQLAQNSQDQCNCSGVENAIEKLKRKINPGTPDLSEKLVSLYTGRKYFISTEKLNWYKAFQRCKASGLELVSIESKLENDELKRLVDNTKEHYWISATDLGSEGKFYWAGTGQPFGAFNDFPAGQPNNAGNNEHCIHLHHSWGGENTFAWNDINCETQHFRFICELEE